MSNTCAEVAAAFVTLCEQGSNSIVSMSSYAWKFQQCSDFPKPKKTKQVWQWRYLPDRSYWALSVVLYSEEEAKKAFSQSPYEKHAGPFAVEE